VDEPAPAVTRLTISNPDKRGALDHAILDEFKRLVPTLDARCLIITGEGTMFSAGYDIRDLPDSLLAEEADKLITDPFAEAIEAIERFPAPTVACLNGHTLGGGLELAITCDLRIAATEIQLAMPPAKLGLVYAHTGLQRFIDTIGAPRTRELFLTARRIDASTALNWGLVNYVVDADALSSEALRLASEIAGLAPTSQRGNKQMIRALLEARASIDPGVQAELLKLRREGIASADFSEGLRAFREKRTPEWQDR
jgi:enoyl-CoA hydratase/carnithine racemase